MLPDKIFFTGVPGSRWSGIAQEIKKDPAYNCSDRAEHRKYYHNGFSGHCDAYFGTGMEFACDLSEDNLNAPFSELDGIKLLLSHEWCYRFDEIRHKYPKDWIYIIYRNNEDSYNWWKQAGGFGITYPNYDWYEDDKTMQQRIAEQNNLILSFAAKHNLVWEQNKKHHDIFYSILKT
jgi:hypothetical protein